MLSQSTCPRVARTSCVHHTGTTSSPTPARVGRTPGLRPLPARPFTSAVPAGLEPKRASTLVRAEANFRYPVWDYIWRVLVDNIESVSPSDAAAKVASGEYVFLDVRTSEVYDVAHVEGAFSAPLFRKLNWTGGNIMQAVRGVAYLVNGVQPVEQNPDFIENAKKVAESGKGVIVYCEAGGTLLPSTNFMTGKTSRSLKAAYRIFDAKITDKKILHMEGGIYGYSLEGLPMTGEYTAEDAGRSPNVAAAPSGEFIDKK